MSYESIPTLLNELFAIDPSLRSHEEALMKAFRVLIDAGHEIAIDEQFASRLRAQLMETAEHLHAHPIDSQSFMKKIHSSFSIRVALGGATLLLLIAIPIYVMTIRPGTSVKQLALRDDTGSSLNKVSITRERAGAFGTLSSPESFAAPVTTPSAPQGLGGGGNAAVPQKMSPDAAVGYGGGGVGMMPPYEPTQYKHVYTGEPITLSDATIQVLKRVRSSTGAALATRLLRSFAIDGVSLSSFRDSTVQNIAFVQNIEYGYAIAVDLVNGSVSISENWEQWQNAMNALCVKGPDGACQEYLPIAVGAVPDDASLIAIATRFLNDHDISLVDYGTPVILDDWRSPLRAASDQPMQYVPDVVTITYPLYVNGMPVLEEAGNPTGLRVTVNLRFNRVSNVWGLQLQHYEASDYPAVTDPATILALAERGGINMPPLQLNWKVSEVTLGTPQRVYMQHYLWKNGTGDELLVPALSFPVLNAEGTEYYYRKAIVVPLAKELVDAAQNTPQPILYDSVQPKQ